MYGYIYKTTCLITNKIYIGKHKSEVFVGTKYLGSGKHLTNAVKLYGKENFYIELLCECNSLCELNNKEKFYIKMFNSRNRDIGMNISIGGDGAGIPNHPPTFVDPHTEESKLKNKFATRDWNLSRPKEDYEKLSNHHKGSKMMTNGTVQCWVYANDIQSKLDDGWWFGSCKKRSRDYSFLHGLNNPCYNRDSNACPIGKVWIHKYIDGKLIRKFIKKQFISDYINDGYEFGMK